MPLKANPLSIPLSSAPAETTGFDAGDGGSHVVPPISQVPQRVEEWCWAACAQMVLNHFGANVQQCDVVNRQFGQTICCTTPDDQLCNQPVDPADIASVYEKFGHHAELIASAISFDGLQSEIAGGNRPVQVGLAWAGVGGHTAIVWGVGIASQGPVLLVNDPKYGTGSVYYVNLVQAYGLGSWQWTWVSIS